MSNAAALYLPYLPEPRPDLIWVKTASVTAQATTSAMGIVLPPDLTRQESWRQTIVEVVAIGDHIATDSRWGDKLSPGDMVVVVMGTGEGYLIGESETPHRLLSPACIVAKFSDIQKASLVCL